MQRSLAEGQPYGSAPWQKRTASRLGLESTLRLRRLPKRPNNGTLQFVKFPLFYTMIFGKPSAIRAGTWGQPLFFVWLIRCSEGRGVSLCFLFGSSGVPGGYLTRRLIKAPNNALAVRHENRLCARIREVTRKADYDLKVRERLNKRVAERTDRTDRQKRQIGVG